MLLATLHVSLHIFFMVLEVCLDPPALGGFIFFLEVVRVSRTNEVSKLTGIPRTTLQRYEKDGLVSPERTSGNYRDYSQEDILRLFFIQVYKQLNYSHGEIRRIFEDPSYNLVNSLNQQRAELYMKAQSIAAQMALIDYLKRMLGDEREASIEEQLYLLIVYPEYRWVLEAEGDPKLLKLLEKINPYLDMMTEWKETVAKLQRDAALASAQSNGNLSESDQDSVIEQVRALLEPLVEASGAPIALPELHIGLVVARARKNKPDSDYTQHIIDRAVQKLADSGDEDPKGTLINFVEGLRREESKTLLLLLGVTGAEQEVFIEYSTSALENYMTKEKTFND